jgi:FkbM family methyltransferase
MTFKDKLLYKLAGAQASYSQFGEDLILEHIFTSAKMSRISYLDIGTNDPRKCNNTFKFYEHGSKGVCVEPNPVMCDMIRKQRPEDVCINAGVGLTDQKALPFFVMKPHTLSTFSKADAEELSKEENFAIDKIIEIPVRNINSIIKENFSAGPDLVSLDVEGLNEELALSINLKAFRPKVLCIETVTYSASNQGIKLQKIIDFMLDNDYLLYADTHVNSIFIDKRWKQS